MSDTNEEGGPAGRRLDRRRFLAAAGASAGLAALAGCTGMLDGGTDGPDPQPGQIGSGRVGRDAPGGTSMAEMPELSGALTVYSGRGEFLVGELVGYIEEQYPDLDLRMRYDSATQLANQIRTEGENTPADVFFTVNSGVLGLLANEERTRQLPEDVLSLCRERYRDPNGQWVGTSGRIRTVPYNTDALDGVPDDIFAFPDDDRFADEMGWAPTYSSFQGFVTAMRILNGEEETRRWLEAMLDHGVREYPNEFRVAQAVADGEISAGFTNHYYVQRVIDGRGGAPIEMGFTTGDAGSFFNVAGAAVVDVADDADLAANFVRHLLSAEAQDYFARTRTFEYPMIEEVEPIGVLPTVDELDPPDIDLAEFASADVNETVSLMEAAGVL